MASTKHLRTSRLLLLFLLVALTLSSSSEACGKLRSARWAGNAAASSSASSAASASSSFAKRAGVRASLARRDATLSAAVLGPPSTAPAGTPMPADGMAGAVASPAASSPAAATVSAPGGAGPATPGAGYPSMSMPSVQNATANADEPMPPLPPAGPSGAASGLGAGAAMPPGADAPLPDQTTGAAPLTSAVPGSAASSSATPAAASPPPATNLTLPAAAAAAPPAASSPTPASAPAPTSADDEDPGEDIEAATFPEDGSDPVRKPTGPTYNNTLHMPVDQASCQGTEALQLDRALTELAGLAELGLKSLLDTPLAPINQRYWGSADEADLSIPVGVLTRLSGGNKTNIIIRCDGNKTLCSTDIVAKSEGGYVATASAAGSANSSPALMKLNVTNNVMLCPASFAGGKAERRWIEEICLDEWTLSANNPTVYWPASLLSLVLQAPVMSSPLMQTPVHAYANVLELARRDPMSSTHSVYTYLYFLLDIFAQKHIPGGCVGQVSGRVREG